MMDGAEITPSRMLRELDWPAGEDERQQILRRFGDALDPIDRMLTRQEFTVETDVYQRIAIIHLLSRSLSDLLAGGHLASHFYLPQAHSVLRPVIDSCDLMDLFADSPEQAERWVSTDKAHIDFAPAAVRKLLGRDKFDPVHSYFSESGSHPRIAGAKLSGALVVSPLDPDEQTAIFRVGPLWPEHPSTLLVWPFIFLLTVKTAECGARLIPLVDTERQAAERFWLHAFLECVNASDDGAGLALAQLGEPLAGIPESRAELREPYVEMRAAAEARLAEFES
jgi:hypothetical protein